VVSELFGFDGEFFSFKWSKSTWRLSTVSLGGKDLIFPIWIYFSLIIFSHCVEKSIEKMTKENQSTVKSLNPRPMKIDVAKFNATNDFRM